MGQSSAIEWTDATWNPTVGCTRISDGCRHCYAFDLHDMRHAAHKAGKRVPLQYAKPFKELQLMPDRLADPLHWRAPRRVFVNSMSDLFHEDVPDEFLDRAFATMAASYWHTFQVLTKRPLRMLAYLSKTRGPGNVLTRVLDAARAIEFPRGYVHPESFGWPYRNVWLGVSVEDQQRADERIPLLLQTPAAVRFLSCEPLLGAVQLDGLSDGKNGWLDCLGGVWGHGLSTDGAGDGREQIPDGTTGDGVIDWVIVGGESGHGARPMNIEWARSLVQQCKAAGVACFVKQLGADPRYQSGHFTEPNPRYGHPVECLYRLETVRDRKGGNPDEWPSDLRVREFPEIRKPADAGA